MENIRGFEIEDKIYESTATAVYRGRRSSDGLPVVIKSLKNPLPCQSEINRFKNEYNILQTLNIQGVCRVLDLIEHGHQYGIVFEEFPGAALRSITPKEGFSTSEFLSIAIKITRILDQIHAAGIIHKDVNPSNVLLDQSRRELRIIDFGISTSLTHEIPSVKAPNLLEGTLAYISPEQTGRMNRLVDYRTDFYSLGASFYHLIVGDPPFDFVDSLELIHAHMAKSPRPPHIRKKEIPVPVSDIIMKLLSKSAEDRYQSSKGLLADLNRCFHHLEFFGKIDLFPLGQEDHSDKLNIFRKLYGRERELEILGKAFDETRNGARKFVMLAGYAGVGKTSLAKEISRSISLKRGFFVSGKFDKLQKDMPYRALVRAFQELVRRLLMEPEKRLDEWKKKISAALGVNAAVVQEVIPEIHLIIGARPPAPKLAPSEAQNRFRFVFQNFVRVFCEPEHPLTIFLDDLQWADSASLKLLKLMITDEQAGHMFIIGAYRDNEIEPGSVLDLFLDAIEKEKIDCCKVKLNSLSHDQVQQWIMETLGASREKIKDLAELVLHKTGGNPFFTSIFLKSLHAEKLLVYNTRGGEWQWKLAEIQKLDIAEDLADLLLSKIKRYSHETQYILTIASAIGVQFNLDAVANLSGKSWETCTELLREPVRGGVLAPIDENHLLADSSRRLFFEDISRNYRFTHDKIRNVIYSMIEAHELSALHCNIGRRLLEKTPEESMDENIFKIVNQLNLGLESIIDSKERNQLVRLNLKAGQKAKASTAYESSLNYFSSGIEILPPKAWKNEYKQTLMLFVEAAESAYLSGFYDRMEQLSEEVIKNAREFMDQVKIYEIKIQALNAQYKLQEAAETAITVLNLLGVHVPKKINKTHIGLSYVGARLMIVGKRVQDLADAGKMKEPYRLAAMRIMMSVSSALYFSDPLLFRFLLLKMVKYSLIYGNAPSSPYSYAIFGLILCGVIGEISVGHQFGSLALGLIKKSDSYNLRSRTMLMLYAFVHHWKTHIRESLPPLEKAHQYGLETGDLEYASFSAFFSSFYSFAAGEKLPMLKKKMERNSDSIRRLKHETALYMHEIYRQTVVVLTTETERSCSLEGDFYDERLMLPIHLSANDQTTLCNMYFNKLFVCFLFEQFDEAIKNAELAERHFSSIAGAFGVALVLFLDSLSRLATKGDYSIANKMANARKIARNQKKLKKWAKHAPMNHLHKYLLVEAERCRAAKRRQKAKELYDAAIENSKKEGFLHEFAIAHELAAKFYLECNELEKATEHIKKARGGFLKWGATAKVKIIDETYEEQLSQFKTAWTVDRRLLESALPTTTISSFERLDLASVMKASQAISSEIVLERLLDQLMKIVIENAGAQTGALILEKGGKLVIEAQQTTDSRQAQVLLSVPLEQSEIIPSSVINYVARTREHVVLENALKDGDFSNDPQILARRCVSVYCGPIQHKTRLLGVLYLENNLITGAFTHGRLEVLKLLISQIGISLENARLFSHLEESELRYRQLYESIIDMVVLIDSNYHVLVSNPRFYETLGLDANEPDAADKNFKRWILADDRQIVRTSLMDRLKEGEEVKNLQFRLQNKTGQVLDIECSAKRIRIEKKLTGYQMVLRDITERKRLENKLIDSIRDVESARTGTILGLAKLAEYRDEDTGVHLERIREYTRILTEELSRAPKYKNYITKEYIDDIYFSSILHDIGKVGIPDSILLKPSKLTSEEFEVIKRHSTIGGDVLSQVNAKVRGRSFLTIGMQIAYFHHEKWNGAGYPKGLKGDEIPLSARIVALADVYDALTSNRIYKKAFSHEKARKIIEKESEEHFDPEIVKAFLKNETEFDKIRREMQEDPAAAMINEFMNEFQKAEAK